MLELVDFLYKHKYGMIREFTLDENFMGPKGHENTVIMKPFPYFFPSKNFRSTESL
jgi:hypothetical protein